MFSEGDKLVRSKEKAARQKAIKKLRKIKAVYVEGDASATEKEYVDENYYDKSQQIEPWEGDWLLKADEERSMKEMQYSMKTMNDGVATLMAAKQES